MSSNSTQISNSFQNRYVNPAWIKRLMDAFPLPIPDDNECRDEFLQNLFKSFTPPMMITPADSSSSFSDVSANRTKGVTFRSVMTFHSMNVEEKLMGAKINADQTSMHSYSFNSSKSADSVATINMRKVMLTRLDNAAQLLSILAILYALNNLRSKIYTLRNTLNPHVSYDKTLRMFSWSLKDYYARFNRKNEVYCDTFVMEVGDQIECVKFLRDLTEIIRLLDLLIQDVEKVRNICEHSMKAITEAQTDIFDLLTESKREAQQEYENIMLETLKKPVFQKTTKSNFSYSIGPIEARYQINWTKSKFDQAEMFDKRKCEEMIKELAWLKAECVENESAWNSSQLAYDMQITELKQRITNMEFLYEQEMFNMDLKTDKMKAKLSKVKEDLEFYKEQIPMFHEKIEKTQNILAQREMLERRAQRKSTIRRSTLLKAVPPKKNNTNKTTKKK